MSIFIAYATRHESKSWRNVEFADAEAFASEYFSDHKEGLKEGACITQGHIRGGERKANQVTANYIVMFDHDNGETMDEIEANIRETGLNAILSTTHSHEKTTTKLTQNAVVSWRRRHKFDTDVSDVEVIKDYLLKAKKWIPRMCETIESAELEHLDSGQTYVVTHAPMPRTRSVFLLDEPFYFTQENMIQKDRIAEWKDRYKGFAETVLKVGTDPTCVDPSRLMYLPRHPAGANHEIRFIAGAFNVSLEHFVRYSEVAETPKSKQTREKGKNVFKTRGLKSFILGETRHTFRAAEFMRAHLGDPRVVRDGVKEHFCCPNDDMHSNAGDDKDNGFFAVDAEGDRPFVMYCSHQSCQDEFVFDRARFLDKACENFGIEDANELLQYTDSTELTVDDMNRKYEPVLDMDLLVNSLMPETSAKIIEALLWQMHRECSEIEKDRLLEKIKEKTKIGKPVLTRQLNALVAQALPPSNVEERIASDTDIPAPPSPDNPNDWTLRIFNAWEWHDKRYALIDAVKKRNEQKMILFRNTDHRVIRVNRNEFGAVLTELDSPEAWAQIVERLGFSFFGAEKKTIAPPAALMKLCYNFDGWDFPIIEATADVPMFGPNAEIMTDNGYHPDSRVWLDTDVVYRKVPDVITDSEVEFAKQIFVETLVDFPFSDVFNGNDPQPLRIDGEPNWERGVSSRAHAIAMLLQPFCRALITGPTPMYYIDKPVKGTGAGYLCNILGAMLHDAPLNASVVPEREEEFEKRVTAYLLGGQPYIFLDNLNHELSSAALAGALTTGVWVGRRLGQSEQVRLPVKCSWILTANRGTLSDELMRRVVAIRLDAGLANPDVDRPGDYYFIKDFPQHLKDRRLDLVWAAHVLILNYVQCKMRGVPGRTERVVLQSFQNYSDVMGDILHYADIGGFLDNRANYIETRKSDTSTRYIYIAEAIVDALGEREDITAAEVCEALSGGAGLHRGTGTFDIKFGIFLRDSEDMDEKIRKVAAALREMDGQPQQLPDTRQVVVFKTTRGMWGCHIKDTNVIPLRRV